MSAKLYLIPCPIGENAPIEMLPISIKTTITNTDFFIVEHEKEARRFIKKILPEKNQDDLFFFQINWPIFFNATFLKSLFLAAHTPKPNTIKPNLKIKYIDIPIVKFTLVRYLVY